MRVTHVITRLNVGGAQENTISSVLGLRRRPGYEVDLISGPSTGPEGSLEGLLASSPGVLQVVPSLVRPIHPWHDLRAWQELTRTFRRTRPDVVHTHSGKAGLLGRLAAHRAGVPVIIHGIHGPSFGPFQGSLTNAVLRAAERWAGRLTTHFVVVANAMTQQYLAAGIGRPELYTCIRSGFDLGPYSQAGPSPALRQRLGIAPGDCVVGMVARLFKLKGHDDLLAAAPEWVRRHPNMKFLLVGDGVWRDRIEVQARAAGVASHMVFAGLVSPDQIASYMGIMDLLVHLSRREGLPRAVAQALAAARPVVVYDCDGAGEVCRDEETGFLVRPGDIPQLVDRVTRLASDIDLRHRLGRAGQSFVQEHFSVDGMVEALDRLYRRLHRA